MLRPLVRTPIGLVGGVSVLLLQLAYEAILLTPDFFKLVVAELAPLFPRVAFELFPLALDDVPVHLRLPLATDSNFTLPHHCGRCQPPWRAAKRGGVLTPFACSIRSRPTDSGVPGCGPRADRSVGCRSSVLIGCRDFVRAAILQKPGRDSNQRIVRWVPGYSTGVPSPVAGVAGIIGETPDPGRSSWQPCCWYSCSWQCCSASGSWSKLSSGSRSSSHSSGSSDSSPTVRRHAGTRGRTGTLQRPESRHRRDPVLAHLMTTHAAVLLSKGAGALADEGAERTEERLVEALRTSGYDPDVVRLEGGEIENAARRAADEGADVVIACGADGSVAAAASALVGRSTPPRHPADGHSQPLRPRPGSPPRRRGGGARPPPERRSRRRRRRGQRSRVHQQRLDGRLPSPRRAAYAGRGSQWRLPPGGDRSSWLAGHASSADVACEARDGRGRRDAVHQPDLRGQQRLRDHSPRTRATTVAHRR